jgi:tryptophan synthase alpha chain
MLESTLRARLRERGILLMTHIVIGYPTMDDSFRIIETMVEAGVDLMELQIPFSEPIADGPVILHANQQALATGTTVQKCFDLAHKVTRTFDIPFLFMSYYNILFKYGVERFATAMSEAGLHGAIVPDLPPEEGRDYLQAMARHSLVPIFIFSPTTTDQRMHYIASFARGFVYCVARKGVVYCVARKGVTGLDTSFSAQLEGYLARCHHATDLPLALGFGVKDRTDVDFLKGKADIAVIGTQTIRLVDSQGIGAVGEFIRGLR